MFKIRGEDLKAVAKFAVLTSLLPASKMLTFRKTITDALLMRLHKLRKQENILIYFFYCCLINILITIILINFLKYSLLKWAFHHF